MMKITPLDLIELSKNECGFSVLDCGPLTQLLCDLVTLDISEKSGVKIDNLAEAIEILSLPRYAKFRSKDTRMLSADFVRNIKVTLCDIGFILDERDCFITDEEQLGWGNIYWRFVRANTLSDVGHVHADRWFWDLGHGTTPETHTRVKTWVPLVQDNLNPSLLVLPGSHNTEFTYDCTLEHATGKLKPQFYENSVINSLVPAPIRVGEMIIFNDALLHGGRPASVPRISVEWTTACLT